jgi:hypothetical protein
MNFATHEFGVLWSAEQQKNTDISDASKLGATQSQRKIEEFPKRIRDDMTLFGD